MRNQCLFLFIAAVVSKSQNAKINDICETGNGRGKCVLISDCPKAVTDLRFQKFPRTCTFKDSEPRVCCEQTRSSNGSIKATVTRRSADSSQTVRQDDGSGVGSISRKKCQEYGKYAFEERPSAVLLIVDEPVKLDKCAHKSTELIVGGEKADLGEFPHMAAIGFDVDSEKKWKCGGTLISERFVLSAAHCVHHSKIGYAKYVRLGDLNLATTDDDAPSQEFSIKETVAHPNYRPPRKYNDIALFKLDKPANLNVNVRPACLHTNPELPITKAVATGWGSASYLGANTDELSKVTLELFTLDECKPSYKLFPEPELPNGIQYDSQLCAGSYTESKDACQGDSGGPLQIYSNSIYCMYEIVGVTSFGKSCGVVTVPGVYTRVSNYIGWIEEIVWGS